jgi:hypothetical protein
VIVFGSRLLSINGRCCGQSTDRYSEIVAHDDVDLGSFEFKEGTNQLTVEIAGSNEKAIHRHMFGLDYLTLEPIGP